MLCYEGFFSLSSYLHKQLLKDLGYNEYKNHSLNIFYNSIKLPTVDLQNIITVLNGYTYSCADDFNAIVLLHTV